METELCNMCMVMDGLGRVLVQERLPKPSNPWSGLTFPGGHVEPGETVVASVIWIFLNTVSFEFAVDCSVAPTKIPSHFLGRNACKKKILNLAAFLLCEMRHGIPPEKCL